MKAKRINKVYINIKRMHYDFHKKYGRKLTNQQLADFIFADTEHPLARIAKYNRKIKEKSKYEFTLTECYNLCIIFKIKIDTFFKKYILPL